jgi:RNA polymerase sigma-70 factor (family 1)
VARSGHRGSVCTATIPPDPRRLAARLAADDESALDQLYHTYATPLYRFVYRHVESAEEARDAVQDVFLKLWRQRRQLRPDTDLRAYLYAMARNRAMDHLRRRRLEDRVRSAQTAAPAEDAAPSIGPGAEEQLAADELADGIRHALEALPYRQREVLLLRWQRQLTNEEIAAELGISVKTVEMHVTRAIKTLRPILTAFFR